MIKMRWCKHHGPHIWMLGGHIAFVYSKHGHGISFKRYNYPAKMYYYLRLGKLMITNSEG